MLFWWFVLSSTVVWNRTRFNVSSRLMKCFQKFNSVYVFFILFHCLLTSCRFCGSFICIVSLLLDDRVHAIPDVKEACSNVTVLVTACYVIHCNIMSGLLSLISSVWMNMNNAMSIARLSWLWFVFHRPIVLCCHFYCLWSAAFRWIWTMRWIKYYAYYLRYDCLLPAIVRAILFMNISLANNCAFQQVSNHAIIIYSSSLSCLMADVQLFYQLLCNVGISWLLLSVKLVHYSQRVEWLFDCSMFCQITWS
jgi:hypothetical protein